MFRLWILNNPAGRGAEQNGLFLERGDWPSPEGGWKQPPGNWEVWKQGRLKAGHSTMCRLLGAMMHKSDGVQAGRGHVLGSDGKTECC
ncbi:hypothetical protein ACP90_20365 [Labrenzia sp. CP4]|nr:hypothetical protein ACP90_20365 [Labrenzia sp. CP4]